MPKKISEEEVIVNFFNANANTPKGETVFNIVKGIMRRVTSAGNGSGNKTKSTKGNASQGTKGKAAQSSNAPNSAAQSDEQLPM